MYSLIVTLKNFLSDIILRSKPRHILKAAVLFAFIPTSMILYAIWTTRMSMAEGLIAFIIAFIGAGITALPALRDLSALREYVDELAENKELPKPSMHVLGAVENLPATINKLEEAHRTRTLTIETTLRKNHAIFHALPTPVLVLSSERIVLEANSAGRDAFKQGVIGKRIDKVIVDPSFHQACTRLNGYEELAVRIEIPGPEGSIRRYYQCVLHPLTPKEMGEHSHRAHNYDREAVICLLYDVSDIVKTNNAMQDFVANASHEIQTPLTGIIGFIEAMLEEDFPRDSDHYEQFLSIAAARARALSALSKDLLSLAKIEMSSNQVFEHKVNIASLAQEAVEQYKFDGTLLKKRMILKESIDTSIPDFYGNPTELRLMISNLLSNAVKYGLEDSKIDCCVTAYNNDDNITQQIILKRYKAQSIYYADYFICVTVRNDSVPIPADIIPRLTERFYRADSSRGEGISGTGIGLSIVQRIIAHHDGILHITSTEKDGTAFTAYFPVDTQERPEQENTPANCTP